ncbi:uncharacterized protein NMK_0514 [Novimethylophilus kurashikiensis]|uniref:Amine oxidase domain-containing protein n=1 Tax=Novimethylophilus kurashikiensis TaxID=1825523 RepID=A0A2R5F374_9PROT|nr:hydroxysqualene dehydroxylase HpnE [Novimethylophilus kurashikiensis]GBG12977.1 uncharacterized protein NMK_0514 [Novimethylophilus kurashikiensis]
MGAAPLKVAVIGGGWSGLAAAVELAHAGVSVTVFEAAPNLGGRARGFSRNGLQLDNGQHILLGAYRQTLQLLRKVGVDEHRVLQRLPLRLETPGHLLLSTPRLPAPLHLAAGLLRAAGLSWAERWAALRFVIGLRKAGFRAPRPQTSVADLLASQPERLVKLLWEPLCLAALNTPIGTASAQVFLNVLHNSFGRARADSDLLLPRVDLSSLFPLAAADDIRARGGEVRIAATVSTIVANHSKVEVDGEPFSHVICAVSPHNLPRLLASLPEMTPLLDQVARLDYQPIATVYLQYPQQVALPFPMLGMTGGFGQWVFDRGELCKQAGLLAVVISAEGPHLQLPQEALADAVHAELQTLLGPLSPPEWHQVIIEKRATFACVADMQRPNHITPHPRILIAGDYTTGDYPATLEGAVRSGVQCATLLISQADS